MSEQIQKIQERVNAAADKEAWEIIHEAFAPAKAVCGLLRGRYPKFPNWEYECIWCKVYSSEYSKSVEVRVGESLLRDIENALFEAVKEHARQVHTDEFLAKMSSVLP